jgi:hypothetical protein
MTEPTNPDARYPSPPNQPPFATQMHGETTNVWTDAK